MALNHANMVFLKDFTSKIKGYLFHVSSIHAFSLLFSRFIFSFIYTSTVTVLFIHLLACMYMVQHDSMSPVMTQPVQFASPFEGLTYAIAYELPL